MPFEPWEVRCPSPTPRLLAVTALSRAHRSVGLENMFLQCRPGGAVAILGVVGEADRGYRSMIRVIGVWLGL